MEKPSEKRTELRLRGAFTVLIETWSAAPGDRQPPRVVICNTLDVSANGLMLCLDDPLPMEAIFQLHIESASPPYRFHLVGEVRWSEDLGKPNGHRTGFFLYDSDGSDIVAWKRLVADLIEQQADAD